MSDDGRILFYSAIGVGAGIYFFYNGFRLMSEKRLIENTPTSKVRSLAMGMVEVYGEAHPSKGKLFKSPFSGKDCVWCNWTVEEYRSSGKSSHWQKIRSGILSDYFFLKDDTGSVLVDPNKANIDVPIDFEAESGSFRGKLPATAVDFLNQQNVSTTGFLGLTKKLRVKESYIAPKDKVYIMGTAGDNPFVEDGSSQKNETDIMIQKGKSFYYISDKPEREVLKKYGWKVTGGLFGGAALIIVCLFVIFAYLRIL
ncbi:hypothetical protein JXA85_06395 [Candidatus Woesearchaeota archaeon]|nr:hypothetical protein [Candidatus Woesearchaeota archaeon]